VAAVNSWHTLDGSRDVPRAIAQVMAADADSRDGPGVRICEARFSFIRLFAQAHCIALSLYAKTFVVYLPLQSSEHGLGRLDSVEKDI